MRMSTFCILLASVLLLSGALIGGLMKANRDETGEEALLTSGQEAAKEAIIAVDGRAERYFGAEYSQELNQWTQNLCSVIKVENKKEIQVMADCTVAAAKSAEGGSRIELTAGETTIIIQPVKKLRVFEGSRLKRGDVIGEAEGKLEISAETGGEAVDPLICAVIAR